MNDDLIFRYFPLFFAGMWLLITTLLGVFSGWFGLQAHYPANDEQPIVRLRGRSGSMGIGVGLNGILSLAACPSGLRISIWRLFGPFQRAIQVPWRDISVEQRRLLFTPAVLLRFGSPAMGTLKIDARSWQRLRDAVDEIMPQGLLPPQPRITKRAAAQGFLVQWALITLATGCFFYFAPRLQGQPFDLPIAVCFGFPAIVFGIGTFIRFLREG